MLSYGGASRTDDLAGAKKRDELTDDVGRLERIDRDIGRLTAMQGRVAVGAASASDLSRLEGELTRKYGSEAEKYGTALSPGTTLADLQATQTAMRNGLGQKYAGDMDALGVARFGSLADTDNYMKQLRNDVNLGVVTRSEKGCMVVSVEDAVAAPAFPVEKVVDTTGAGDLFAAGFLYGLARNLAYKQCGELGALAAAEVIQHICARPQVSLKELAQQRGLTG